MDALPRKVTRRIANRKAAGSSVRASGLCVRAAPPSVTSVSARNRAMRSSDFRQKISTPTTNEVTANRSSTEVRYPAKKPAERPNAPSSRTFAGVSVPGWHAPVEQTVWSRESSAGMLTTIQTTVRTATTVHAARAISRRRPLRSKLARRGRSGVTDRCSGERGRFTRTFSIQASEVRTTRSGRIPSLLSFFLKLPCRLSSRHTSPDS